MSFAFKPQGGAWIEVSEAGTELPGAGEYGEDVVMSHAFIASLPSEVQASRGFVEVAEVAAPANAIGWTVEDVAGVPTRTWQIAPESP